MRAHPVLFSFTLAASSFAATLPPKTTPLESKSESKSLVAQLLREGKIMRASDAKRGQRGYALSVFQGTKIERFQIEVLGTLERVQSGGDLVMIKVLDGPVVKRQSGIIQGMSGSPVYINGKLLGAIAIGFGFPKEPIGGVTPITQMIEGALPDDSAPRPNPELKPVTRPVSASAVYQTTTPIVVAGREIKRVEVTRNRKLAALDGSTMRMRPCTNYVLLSGVSPSNFPSWQKMLAPYDVTPVLGGGALSGSGNRQAFGMSSRKTGVKASLIPGAGIGVQLASGDIDVSGVGTVTYRIGQRVLAFGHPMFGLGAVSMPMTTAYVHDIFPSYDTSFKLASPIAPVGELQQDTAFAVGGTVGRRAQTIPMTIHVRDDLKHINRTFHINLIQDPTFTPQLATQTATEAVQGELGLQSGKTVKTSLRLKLRGLPEIRRSNTTYSDDPAFGAALSGFTEALGLSQGNPFEKGALQSVSIDAQVVPGRKTATIRRLLADRNRVKAGETVNLSVALSPSNQPDVLVTRRFSVKVPADAPDGVLRVAVSPADNFWSARSRVGGAPPRPGNLRELLQAYERIGRSDELLLQVSTPRRFLLVDRKRVDNPPASWNRLVGGAPGASSIASYNETLEARQPAGFVLDGLETLTLPVEGTRRSAREKPDAATPDSGTATASASSDTPTTSDSSSSTPVVIELPPDGAPLSTLRAPAKSEMNLNWAQKLFGPGGLRALPLDTLPRVEGRKRETVAPTTATPAPTPTPTPAATPTPTPTPDAGAGNIARPAGKWIQKGAADFARGEFSGSLVRADGTLGVGPTSRLISSTPENVAWSVAGAPDGTTYIGTGNNARLFRVRNGVSKVIYEGPEVAVSALICDSAGNLYAGVSPGGRVYRFAPDGTHATILQTNEEFIGALAFDGSGNLLVGTGGARGAVYRVENPSVLRAERRTGPLTPLATTSAKHIRSLAFSNGSIYAGTSDDATLLRVTENGTVETLYEARSDAGTSLPTPEGATASTTGADAAQSAQAAAILAALGVTSPDAGTRSGEITGVAPVGDTVYFSLLSSGSVFRWTRARGVEEAAKTGARAIYSLRAGAGGTLFAGTGESGELFQIAPRTDGTFDVARVLDGPQNQVSALEVEADGRVLAGTSNNAALWQLAPGTSAGLYTSNVFDAGNLVRWGTLRALGRGFFVETRSGETADPDATWTPFVPLGADQKIASPSARYLQYRTRLSQNAQFQRVETSFRSPNRAPKLSWTLPSGGEYLSGKKTLSWTGTDPDSDPLRFSLEIEKNGVFVPVELSNPTQSTFELDTSKFADGVTSLRLRASDATRNPDDPRDASLVSLPFVIDNTPPALAAVQLRRDGAVWNLTASATDATSPLSGAEWRVLAPDAAPAPAKNAGATTPTTVTGSTSTTPATTATGSTSTATTPTASTSTGADSKIPSAWTALGASDGLFDSTRETIVGRLDPAFAPTPLPAPLSSGTRIEIRLRDAADNSTTQIVVLP